MLLCYTFIFSFFFLVVSRWARMTRKPDGILSWFLRNQLLLNLQISQTWKGSCFWANDMNQVLQNLLHPVPHQLRDLSTKQRYGHLSCVQFVASSLVRMICISWTWFWIMYIIGRLVGSWTSLLTVYTVTRRFFSGNLSGIFYQCHCFRCLINICLCIWGAWGTTTSVFP